MFHYRAIFSNVLASKRLSGYFISPNVVTTTQNAISPLHVRTTTPHNIATTKFALRNIYQYIYLYNVNRWRRVNNLVKVFSTKTRQLPDATIKVLYWVQLMPVSADILYTVFIYKPFKQYFLYPRLTKIFFCNTVYQGGGGYHNPLWTLELNPPGTSSWCRIIDMGLFSQCIQK